MFLRMLKHAQVRYQSTEKKGMKRGSTVLCTFALLLLSTLPVGAQSPAASQPATPLAINPLIAASAAKSVTVPKAPSKPNWQELTPAQQLSLKPLSENWNTLEEAQKRKWIAIAANYPTLAPAEQTKLHNRMTEWVSLSYQQRAQARLNFAQSKKLSSSEKATNWEAYQALSPEEKKKLATLAPPKVTGAAIAAKPVHPQKLTQIPLTRQTLIETPKTAATNHAVNRHTLLPHPKPPVEPASKPIN